MQDEHVIQALSAQAAYETLAECIRLRGSSRCFEDFDATGHRGKVLSKLAIPIADQVFGFLISGSDFTQLLGNPFVGGISGDSSMYDTAST